LPTLFLFYRKPQVFGSVEDETAIDRQEFLAAVAMIAEIYSLGFGYS
jgi:hypothetical protein